MKTAVFAVVACLALQVASAQPADPMDGPLIPLKPNGVMPPAGAALPTLPKDGMDPAMMDPCMPFHEGPFPGPMPGSPHHGPMDDKHWHGHHGHHKHGGGHGGKGPFPGPLPGRKFGPGPRPDNHHPHPHPCGPAMGPHPVLPALGPRPHNPAGSMPGKDGEPKMGGKPGQPGQP